MIEVRVSEDDWGRVRSSVLAEKEHCAILYAIEVNVSASKKLLLVRDVEFPNDIDYVYREVDRAQLTPVCVARVAKRARSNKLSLIFVHSHPGSQAPVFSQIDDAGETVLAGFFEKRHPGLHVSLVVSHGGAFARVLGTNDPVRVVALGRQREILTTSQDCGSEIDETFDRQVRAFGPAGQRALQALNVAIVGLGGTGSIVAQQLVHLGVRKFTLVDPDIIESTNLNRVVGASPNDVGRPKVDVAATMIRLVAPDAILRLVANDVTRSRVARSIVDVDVLFGCTDSHGSRSVLQQLAYQYFIPCIDMGTTIVAEAASVKGVFGRVQLLSPGLPCLWCCGLLDSEQVRRDLMNAFERKLDPYIVGEHTPAPAVISINATVSSLASTLLMAIACGLPSPARHVIYNALSSRLRSVTANRNENCFICSHVGTLARGDSQTLYARHD